jgi:hypothetical protein
MGAKILVGNLPAGTTAEEVREEITAFGAPVLHVTQSEGRDADSLTFVVELDIDPKTARLMVELRRDVHFKGRKLSMYVPTMMS